MTSTIIGTYEDSAAADSSVPIDITDTETDGVSNKGLTRAPLIIFPIGIILGFLALSFAGGGTGEDAKPPVVEAVLLVLFLVMGIVSIIIAIRLSRPKKRRGISRRIQSILLPIMVFLLFPMGALAIINASQQPEETRRPFTPLAVMADYAVRQDVRLSVQTQGEARPQTEINLVPEVGGKVVYVSPNFIEGGIFVMGETLIRVDPSDYNVAVVRAQAGVAQAEQVLAREIAEGDIARTDYEDLGRGEPSPLALRVPQKQQAQAALQAAKADLENARLQLSRTSVRAPFTGRVRTKTSGMGQFVTPGSQLGRIFSTNIVEVRLPFTDTDMSKIDLPIAFVAKNKDEATPVVLSTVIGGVRQQWDGLIMRTEATYDTQSRALFAIAEVADPYGTGRSQNGVPIAPGLFVDATVQGKIFPNAIVIPRDGLRVEDEIYTVNDKGKASIRKVTVLDATAERAVLASGVEAGELVVLSPMERSRVSIPLKVLNINNPDEVLVEPEEPEWMRKAREGDTKSSDDVDGDDDTAADEGSSE